MNTASGGLASLPARAGPRSGRTWSDFCPSRSEDPQSRVRGVAGVSVLPAGEGFIAGGEVRPRIGRREGRRAVEVIEQGEEGDQVMTLHAVPVGEVDVAAGAGLDHLRVVGPEEVRL